MSGVVSYPRTYGRRRKKAWWKNGGLYLSIDVRKIIIEYKSWKFKPFSYVKRTAPERSTLRRAFDTQHKKEFLKSIAANNRPELEKAGLTSEDIRDMLRGEQPNGYSVHHILPLDDNGDNSHDNLILIREEPEHQAITAFQNSLTRGLREGESRDVDFPVPDGRVVIHPPTDDPPTTLPLWETKGQR